LRPPDAFVAILLLPLPCASLSCNPTQAGDGVKRPVVRSFFFSVPNFHQIYHLTSPRLEGTTLGYPGPPLATSFTGPLPPGRQKVRPRRPSGCLVLSPGGVGCAMWRVGPVFSSYQNRHFFCLPSLFHAVNRPFLPGGINRSFFGLGSISPVSVGRAAARSHLFLVAEFFPMRQFRPLEEGRASSLVRLCFFWKLPHEGFFLQGSFLSNDWLTPFQGNAPGREKKTEFSPARWLL